MPTPQEHEHGIAAFVVRAKRERVLDFLGDERRRTKLLDTLWHFRDWDPRWMVQLAPSPTAATSTSVLAELRRRGAGRTAYIVSATADLDRRQIALPEAMTLIVGSVSGSIVSCIPGRLAYFEGEAPEDRCVLQRTADAG
jgi:hypothetical protein